MIKVAPSILAADYMNLGAEIDKIRASGADYLHFDVMDGMFVSDVAFGQGFLRQAAMRGIPVDAHLMVVRPGRHIAEFARAGAKILTIHAEASGETLMGDLRAIRAAGCMAGVSVKPYTPLETIENVLELVDLVLVMTVEPGKGGQKLLPFTLDKIRRLCEMCREKNLNPMIEVDGGINEETASVVKQAGANVLVAGSAFFRADDPAAFVKALREN